MVEFDAYFRWKTCSVAVTDLNSLRSVVEGIFDMILCLWLVFITLIGDFAVGRERFAHFHTFEKVLSELLGSKSPLSLIRTRWGCRGGIQCLYNWDPKLKSSLRCTYSVSWRRLFSLGLVIKSFRKVTRTHSHNWNKNIYQKSSWIRRWRTTLYVCLIVSINTNCLNVIVPMD